MVDEFGRTCETKLDDVCSQSPSQQCNILLSKAFEQCHSKIQPSDYFKLCQETSCHGQDPCEIIASYGHLCRLHGVCIEWRSSDICREYNQFLPGQDVSVQLPIQWRHIGLHVKATVYKKRSSSPEIQ